MLNRLTVRTPARTALVDITASVRDAIRASGVVRGMAYLYVPHTTCGITIQENADPGVAHDVLMVLERLAPRRDPGYRHMEDNSASHVQAVMTGVSTFLFVEDGAPVLGQWQDVYLAEYDGPRTRQVLVKVVADRE